MTKKFEVEGMRAIRSHDVREAAMTFAERLARREYGRAGRVRALRSDGYASDCSSLHYEAFIGRPVAGGAVSGHNVRFIMYPSA